MIDAHAILYADGREILLHSGRYRPDSGGLVIAKDGIEGWWGTPEAKVDLTERSDGNGAHDIADDSVSYSARTVSIHLDAVGGARGEILAAMDSLAATAGHMCVLRVVDENSDTYVEGYIASTFGGGWSDRLNEGTLTVVCPRPERLSWTASETQMFPAARDSGGLSFGVDGGGLLFPLDFGVDAGSQDTCLLVNRGTATAWPTLTVTGGFDGVLISTGVDAIEYSGYVGDVPLTLDSRSCTASMGGSDVGRNLIRRGFPSVAPGGSCVLRLLSSGSGWVTATVRDTYI